MVDFSPSSKRNSKRLSPFWQDLVRQLQAPDIGVSNRTQIPIPNIPRNLPLNITAVPRKLLLPHEIEITETPAETLVAALASGSLTSVEVTKAFLRRAGLAQKLVPFKTRPKVFSTANGLSD